MDERLDERVEALRRSFAETAFGELDYDTAFNLLVLGGLVFPPTDPQDPRWRVVADYLRETELDRTVGRPGETYLASVE